MKEDYLWDRSGEADPEIEKFERVLGSLRYRRSAKPLPLPEVARPWFRLGLSPALAAAAALAVLILAGGLWLGLSRQTLSVASGPGKPPGPIDPTALKVLNRDVTAPVSLPSPRAVTNPRPASERRQELAQLRNARLAAREQERIIAMRKQERIREGELAKEQLIKALQITSDKLNTVQKRIQGGQENGPVS